MIKVVELAPSGEMKVRHFDVAEEQPAARVEAQPTSRKEHRERRVTVQESGNLYRIRHGMEPSKPTLRYGHGSPIITGVSSIASCQKARGP